MTKAIFRLVSFRLFICAEVVVNCRKIIPHHKQQNIVLTEEVFVCFSGNGEKLNIEHVCRKQVKIF